jgi:hypothetical protein
MRRTLFNAALDRASDVDRGGDEVISAQIKARFDIYKENLSPLATFKHLFTR